MKIIFSKEGETLTISYFGEIDHHSASRIREETDKKIEEVLPEKLIMDFSGVTFSDSSGIAVVIGRYKKMLSYGKHSKIKLINIIESIKKIFEMSGLNEFIEIE